MVVQNKMSALGKPALLYEDGRDLSRGPGYDGNIMDVWNYGFSHRRRVRTRSVRLVVRDFILVQYMYIMIGMAP